MYHQNIILTNQTQTQSNNLIISQSHTAPPIQLTLRTTPHPPPPDCGLTPTFTSSSTPLLLPSALLPLTSEPLPPAAAPSGTPTTRILFLISSLRFSARVSRRRSRSVANRLILPRRTLLPAVVVSSSKSPPEPRSSRGRAGVEVWK
jgi:hypothetical protein